MSDAIFQGTFWEKFLSITHYQTLISIGLLLTCFVIVMIPLQNRKVNFSIRMFIGLILGIVLGLGIQNVAGFPDTSNSWMQETASWYDLFGRVFITFIRMLALPLIFVSIAKIIVDFSGKENLIQIAFRGIFWLLFNMIIACIVGIALANIFELGEISSTAKHHTQTKQFNNIVDTFVNLIPNIIIASIVKENIVGLVIFSVLMGIAANRMEKKNPQPIALFKNFIETLYKIVMSIAMTVIKYMPFVVIAILARTIISNDIPAIVKVSNFIATIYIATLIMLIVHIIIVMIHGVSSIMFIKKALGTWLLAFTCRSSIGTLPMTISTLTVRMGVNTGTANLVGVLSSIMGLSGCASFFPTLLTIMVAHMVGIDTNIQFYIMLVIVVVIGSIGITGIPGTATIAAIVVLSSMDMVEYFPLIGMVLAVDPIIDMARTLTNVSGAMAAAVATDREVGLMDMNVFNDPNITIEYEQSDV